jgi:multidrug transporter EmrE-like cation transporter
MKGYTLLLATILFETLAIVLMKLSNGGINKMYMTTSLICYAATFFLLTAALKFLPMGWTNAIWAGSSTVLVTIIGFIFFHEKISLRDVFFISCIVIGLVGLNFFGKGK